MKTNTMEHSSAIIAKETEKAYMLKAVVEIYGRDFTFTTWFPKSMVQVVEQESDRILFDLKFGWFLNKKVKEYFSWKNQQGDRLPSEISLYLGNANCENVTYCHC